MGLPRDRPFVVVWLLCACPYQPERAAPGHAGVGESSSDGGAGADAASSGGDPGGASSSQGEGSSAEGEASSTEVGGSDDDAGTSLGEEASGAASSSSGSGAQGPVCGDGVVEGDELCDDGNAQDDDACVSSCIPAACGDGHVFLGVEDCDDGNVASADGCPSTCEIPDACDEGVDRQAYDAPWVVCSADAEQAWISFGQVDFPGTYHATTICEQLGYAGVAHYGTSCPHNICGTCEAYSSCTQPGVQQFFDDTVTAVDEDGGIVLYGTVKWLCAN